MQRSFYVAANTATTDSLLYGTIGCFVDLYCVGLPASATPAVLLHEAVSAVQELVNE